MNIDQINYVKPLKRYSLAHMLTCIFALAFAFVAVMIVIKPWFSMSIPAYNDSGIILEGSEISYTAKDVVMNAIGLIKKAQDPITSAINALAGAQGLSWLKYVALATQYMLPAGLVIFAISTLVLTLMGLIGLIKGYSRKYKAFKKWADFGAFGFVLMFIVIMIYKFLIPTFAGKIFADGETNFAVDLGKNYLYIGIIIGAEILIGIVCSTLKGKAYLGALRKATVAKPEVVEEEKKVDAPKVEEKKVETPKTEIKEEKSAANPLIDIKIPAQTKELKAMEFANRKDIKLVAIPSSVLLIGDKCFENCENLATILYQGTKDEFKKIKRGAGWIDNVGTNIVTCKDGKMAVAPKK